MASFAQTFSGWPDGVVIAGQDGIVRYANPVAASLLGRAGENLAGESWIPPAGRLDVRVSEGEFSGESVRFFVLRVERSPLQPVGELAQTIAESLADPATIVRNNTWATGECISALKDATEALTSSRRVESLEARRMCRDIDAAIAELADIAIETQSGVERVEEVVERLRSMAQRAVTEHKRFHLSKVD